MIGYKQFEKALTALPGRFDVSVHWRPFELNPNMPAEGQDLREHIAQKYGSSAEQSQQARSRLSSIGESLGFHFDYYDGMRVVNTFHAHQLLHWAEEQGKQTELKMALFNAFFSQRQDVSDNEVLVSVAGGVGLSESAAREVLSGGLYADAVREDQRWWLDREIHAVPAFIFNDKYSVLGAQEADTFVRVLTKLEAKAAA